MVIGIDTSGLVCSIAGVSDSKLIFEFSTNQKKTHSEQLLPMLDIALQKAGLSVSDADCIAVSNGPGSFTGLRIGAATAQGIAVAKDIPVVEVSSLLALAYNICFSDGLVVPIMDARRSEVYTAAYRFRGESHDPDTFVSEIIEPMAIPITELADKLNELGQKVIFLGDGVPVYKDALADIMKVSYEFAPEHLSLQRAASVAVIGQMYFQNKTFDKNESNKNAIIAYLRRPQAERERLGL